MAVPPFSALSFCSRSKREVAGHDLSVILRTAWNGSKRVPEEKSTVNKMKRDAKQATTTDVWPGHLKALSLLLTSDPFCPSLHSSFSPILLAIQSTHLDTKPATACITNYTEILALNFNSDIPYLGFQLAHFGLMAIRTFLSKWEGKAVKEFLMNQADTPKVIYHMVLSAFYTLFKMSSFNFF